MARFIVNGNKTKIVFEYEANTSKVHSIINDVADNLWVEIIEIDDLGNDVILNPFEDATNQEKLDVVDAHVKSVLLDMANTFKSKTAQRLARETEKANQHSF